MSSKRISISNQFCKKTRDVISEDFCFILKTCLLRTKVSNQFVAMTLVQKNKLGAQRVTQYCLQTRYMKLPTSIPSTYVVWTMDIQPTLSLISNTTLVLKITSYSVALNVRFSKEVLKRELFLPNFAYADFAEVLCKP